MITSMKSSNHIHDVWKVLEVNQTTGLTKLLISKDLPFPIYCTYQYPDCFYGLAFSFDKTAHINISQFDDLSELKIQVLQDGSYPDRKMLIIQLQSSEQSEVFASLCDDLISSVLRIDDEQRIIKTVLRQLSKWRDLFSKDSASGLSTSEQQGLYGELYLLNKMLSLPSTEPTDILHEWVGVDKAMRDFQGADWAIEVKTSSVNNGNRATINGERQLDETLLHNLYLYCLTVEVSRENGQTLNSLIKIISDKLHADDDALCVFNAKLFEAGYFSKHESYYANRCYKTRNERFFKVCDNFPRIREKDLHDGVSDIQYTISLSKCEEYLIPEDLVFKTTISHE